MALRTVALLVLEGTAPFEFGLIHEVFGVDRTDDGVPPFDLRICGPRPGEAITFGAGVDGMQIVIRHGLEAMQDADLVAIPAYQQTSTGMTLADRPDPEVLAALRSAHDRGAHLLSVCSGAFLLGEAGLLDGRACTTHWRHASELQERVPTARVDPDVLFVEDGTIITSAGTAAGIDACLHLVRSELGAEVATRIARRMVVPPQRDGGQRQYIDLPVPECTGDSLQPVLEFMVEHLGQEHSVSALSARASMSTRTFARRFAAETGTTPGKWLALQRLGQVRRLLEETDLTVEQVAVRCGYSSAALLRHHFTRAVGVPPQQYRRQFSTVGAAP
ncbi:MAG: helix-turn-helix domain-containing protein [Nakamurella sp.]